MGRSTSNAAFVGRAAELTRLGSALERAAGGAPATVVVTGDAGVGKTRLVAEFAGRADAAGATVLSGGCLNVGDGLLPYAPVVEALRALALTAEPALLGRALGGARGELARLVPELGEPVPERAAPRPAPATTVPGRLFELVLGVLHRLAEHGPVVVVVEDLHWADRSTRDLLDFLVRNLRAGVVTVLTYRSDELPRRHPLAAFVAELERGRRVERLALGPLGRQELAGLIGGALGHRPALRLVDDVLARSQGNPFFAEELVAAHLSGADLPPALRDLLLVRVDALSDAAQQVLRVAAAGGSRVDHRLLGAVADRPERRLVALLREAVDRHLLVVDDDDAYRFRHALVQEALHDDLLPGERRAVHAAYARALADRRASGRLGPAELGQLAFHWHAAGDAEAALPASIEAGQAAAATFALAEASAHYERAADLLDAVPAPAAAGPGPLDRAALLQRAAHGAMLSGETDRAVALAARAVAAVDGTAEPRRSGALLERLGRYQWVRGDSAAAMATLRRADALTATEPPCGERARILSAHGQLLMLQARNAEAAARCKEAIAIARAIGATAEEGHARTSLGVALAALGQAEEGMAQLREGRRLAEQLGDAEEVCRADHNLTDSLLSAGSVHAALDRARRDREEAVRLGAARTYGAVAVALAAEALVLLGRWDEAERLLADEADLEVPAEGAVDRVLAQGLLARGLLSLGRGDLAAARRHLHAVRTLEGRGLDPPIAASLAARLARAALWDGDIEGARAAVGRGRAALDGCDDVRLCTQVGLAGVEVEAVAAEVARAHRSAGELARSRRTAGELLGWMRAAAAGGGPGGAARAELLAAEAELSRVEGAGDPERWQAAVDAWEALGFPFPAACARFRRAEALQATPGALRGEAAAELRRAWQVAERLGAGWLGCEVTALARRARIDLDLAAPAGARSPEVERPPSPARSFGLTPREREVLALVADGRTNRQIGQVLYISDKTASVHVSRILAKLGVTNRGEAAAVAHRLRLTADAP